MIGPQTRLGGRVLLFDRLIDQAPGQPEVHPMIFYDADSLKASVRRELENLLSTRQSCASAELRGKPRTTMNYGIPDAIHLSPEDVAGQNKLAREIASAIEAFEPRLHHPVVTLDPEKTRNDQLTVKIEGQLSQDQIQERVSYSLAVEIKYGNA